jgi:hypothetical protein
MADSVVHNLPAIFPTLNRPLRRSVSKLATLQPGKNFSTAIASG